MPNFHHTCLPYPITCLLTLTTTYLGTPTLTYIYPNTNYLPTTITTTSIATIFCFQLPPSIYPHPMNLSPTTPYLTPLLPSLVKAIINYLRYWYFYMYKTNRFQITSYFIQWKLVEFEHIFCFFNRKSKLENFWKTENEKWIKIL